jgi:hypothetical protein
MHLSTLIAITMAALVATAPTQKRATPVGTCTATTKSQPCSIITDAGITLVGTCSDRPVGSIGLGDITDLYLCGGPGNVMLQM